VPLLEWLLEYRKEWLRHDLVAGLTTAAVVIPKAMAYATIADARGRGSARRAGRRDSSS
jgi:MFS superfamily sulfate permease-like transporter